MEADVGVPIAPAGPFAPQTPRRRPLRGIFLGLGAAIVVVGAVLLAVSLYPRAFGLSNPLGFPYGGGFLGVFLLLWGTLLLARIAFWTTRRRYYGGGPPGRRFDPAILAARQRYARGEITREQFEQIVGDLRHPPGPLP